MNFSDWHTFQPFSPLRQGHLWSCTKLRVLTCTCFWSETFIFHFMCALWHDLQKTFWMKKWSVAAATCLRVSILSRKAGGLVQRSKNGNDPWQMLWQQSVYSLAMGPAVSNCTLCGGKFPLQAGPFLGTTWAINFTVADITADVCVWDWVAK